MPRFDDKDATIIRRALIFYLTKNNALSAETRQRAMAIIHEVANPRPAGVQGDRDYDVGMTQFAYPHIATLDNGTEVKCRVMMVEKRPNGFSICRRPDPYDQGEIEFKVLSTQVRPDLKPTHTFDHSSMAGTYSTDCELLKVDGTWATVKYYDWMADDILTIEMDVSALDPLEKVDPVLEAFEKEMEGRQYGEDARTNALGWFRAGWKAGSNV